MVGPRLQWVGLYLPPDLSSSRLQFVFWEDTSREGLLLSFGRVNGGGRESQRGRSKVYEYPTMSIALWVPQVLEAVIPPSNTRKQGDA